MLRSVDSTWLVGARAAACTGKAALYRRWPGKAELVADALDHALPAPEDAPDRGNIRDDLIEHMRQKAAVLNSQSDARCRACSPKSSGTGR